MFKKITLGFAFLATALLSAAPVYSQSANLIEAGKKEGKAVVYGSLNPIRRKQFLTCSRKKLASKWIIGARRRPKSWTAH